MASPDIASAQPLLDEFKMMGEQLVNKVLPTFSAAAQSAASYPVTPTP